MKRLSILAVLSAIAWIIWRAFEWLRSGQAFFLYLAVAVCSAQVTILYTPESSASSFDLLRSNKIGLSVVRVCNESTATDVTIPPERIYMANPDFPGMSIDRANLLIGERYRTNPKLTAARLLEYGAIVATLLVSGGTVSASAQVLTSLGVGITGFHLLGDKLKGEVPPLNAILGPLLDAPLRLGPSGSGQECATRTLFSTAAPKGKIIKPNVSTVTLPIVSRSMGDLADPQAIVKFVSQGMEEYDRSVASRFAGSRPRLD